MVRTRGQTWATLVLLVACRGDDDARPGEDATTALTSGPTSTAADDGDDDDGESLDPDATDDDDPDTTSPPDTSTTDPTDPDDTGSDSGPPGSCGDGNPDPGEDCDDGNPDDADGCNTDCTISGSVLWSHSQASGSGEHEDGYGVAVAADGTAFVAGDLVVATRDLFLRQYTAAGGLGFTVTLDGPSASTDGAFGLAIAGDEVYVAGYRTNGPTELFLANYDAGGAPDWTTTYNDPFGGNNGANAVTVDQEGNVIVAGYTVGEFTGTDGLVIKYGPTGSAQWTQTYAGGEADHARGVATDFANNVIAVGFQNSGGQRNVWVRKFTPGGGILWTQTFAGPDGGDDEANAVTVSPNGDIIVAGRETTAALGSTVWLRRYDLNGNEIWTDTYAGAGAEGAEAFGVVLDNAGDITIVGREVIDGLDRILIRKYTADADVRWTSAVQGARGTSSIGRAITLGPDRHLWVAGGIDKGVDGRDVWIAKIAQ